MVGSDLGAWLIYICTPTPKSPYVSRSRHGGKSISLDTFGFFQFPVGPAVQRQPLPPRAPIFDPLNCRP